MIFFLAYPSECMKGKQSNLFEYVFMGYDCINKSHNALMT